MTPTETHAVLGVILAAYPTQRQKMSPEDLKAMLAIYTLGLEDLDAKLVNAAIARLVKTSEWIPTIAKIRSAASVARDGTRREGGEAWGEVLTAIGRYGVHRTPGRDFEFLDPVSARCVTAMSWRELCLSTNQTADRARFTDLYNQLASGAAQDRQAGSELKQLPSGFAYPTGLASGSRDRFGESQSMADLLRLSVDKSDNESEKGEA